MGDGLEKSSARGATPDDAHMSLRQRPVGDLLRGDEAPLGLWSAQVNTVQSVAGICEALAETI